MLGIFVLLQPHRQCYCCAHAIISKPRTSEFRTFNFAKSQHSDRLHLGYACCQLLLPLLRLASTFFIVSGLLLVIWILSMRCVRWNRLAITIIVIVYGKNTWNYGGVFICPFFALLSCVSLRILFAGIDCKNFLRFTKLSAAILSILFCRYRIAVRRSVRISIFALFMDGALFRLIYWIEEMKELKTWMVFWSQKIVVAVKSMLTMEPVLDSQPSN